MKKRPWYRVWPEYIALCIGLGWIPFLPRRAVLLLARSCGALVYRRSRRLRTLGLTNLEFIYGKEPSKGDYDQLLRQTFQQFGLMALDIIWFSRFAQARMKRWIDWDSATSAFFEPGAALLLTAHYGNWETLGQAVAAKGAPIMSVAAPLKNPKVDRLFIRLRQKTGQIIIPQQGAARSLMKGLKEHKKLAILLDQNTLPKDGGIFVDFFETPVAVSSAPAALAIRQNTPIMTGTMTIEWATGRYHVGLHETLMPDPSAEDPIQELTQRMTHAVERIIRENPVHWCWMYKRWRYIPQGSDSTRFPGYARQLGTKELG